MPEALLDLPYRSIKSGPKGSGQKFLDPLKDYIKGCILVPQSAYNPVVCPARTGTLASSSWGTQPPVMFEGPNDAYAEILALVGFHTATIDADVQARLLCQLINSEFERALSNKPVPVNHMWGSVQNNFFLEGKYAESLWIRPQQVLTANFFNPSIAGASSFNIQMHGRKIQEPAFKNDRRIFEEIRAALEERVAVSPYWLAPDTVLSSAAGGQAPGITLAASAQGDALFTVTKGKTVGFTGLMGTALTLGVAGDTEQKVSIQIFEARTERPLQNQPIALSCAAGTSQFMFLFDSPLITEDIEQIRVHVTNLITDASTDLLLTFFGVRLGRKQQ